MRSFAILLSATAFLVCAEVRAQGSLDVDLTLIAGGWTHDMILPQTDNVAVGALALTARWSPTPELGFDGEVFAIGSASTAGQRGRINLKKAYLTFNTDRLTVRAGRQVENWGRADRLNPTDSLSPRDYTILTAEDNEQRLGLATIRADAAISDSVTISGRWIPEFRPTRLLIRLPSTLESDQREWDTGQFAIKLDHSGAGLDWSFSYFQGRDPVLDLALTASGLTERFNRVQVYGGDLATSAGVFGLRIEAAYTKTAFDPIGNPLVRRPELWAVLGVDRTIAGVYANLQFSARHVLAFGEPIIANLSAVRQKIDALRYQQDQNQFGLTLNLKKSWDDGRWNAEFSNLHYFQRQQGLVRLGVRYKIAANISVQLKAQKFYGERNSYFDTIRPASSIGFEVRLAL